MIVRLLLLWCAVLPDSHRSLQELPLNPNTVVRVPISRDRLTTIRFPGPISDLEGLHLATEESSNAWFQISFRPGNKFFSVRALLANASGNINIGFQQQTYVLELFDTNEPCLALTFQEIATNRLAASVPPVEKPAITNELSPFIPPVALSPSVRSNTVPPILSIKTPPDAERLRDLIKITQSSTFLASLIKVFNVQLKAFDIRRSEDDYDLLLHEGVRFGDEDTIIFRLTVHSKTGRPVRYRPEDLSVECGGKFFQPSITTAQGVADRYTTISFGISGGFGGAPHGLSLQSEFVPVLKVNYNLPIRTYYR